MKILKTHIMITPVLFAAALLNCSPAAAGTITYNFADPGWINMAGTTETLSGSFIGTPEANGDLALNDLTLFIAFMTETNAQGDTKTIATFGDGMDANSLSQFLFDPNANTLTIAASGSPGATICLGDAVAEGACGSVPARPVNREGMQAPPIEGLFISTENGTLSSYDTDLPEVLMAPSAVGVAPQPAQTATPEPASSLLCGGALVAVSLALRRVK